MHWTVTKCLEVLTSYKGRHPWKEISELRSDKQKIFFFFKKMQNINGILLISQTASRLEQKDLKIHSLNHNLPL